MTLALIAAAALIAVLLLKSRYNYLRFRPLPTPTTPALPGVTVIIPARNEAHNIRRAVASFPDTPVLVVDDDSTDETAAQARAAGATVIPAPPLAHGWLGKPHACWTGAQRAETEWLLFVDADTWFDADFISRLLAFAASAGADAVSVFPRQHALTLAERTLIPYAFALYFCGVSARAVESPANAEALANGQCLLIRRDAYFAVDGHRAVAGSVIEDVAFASVLKRRGKRLRLLRAGDCAHVRMYDSFDAIVQGFRKNSFRFLLKNPGAGAQIVAASIALTAYLPLAAGLALESLWLPLAIWLLLPSLLLRPWYPNWRDALLAPAAIYLFQYIALLGMFTVLARRKTQWKERPV